MLVLILLKKFSHYILKTKMVRKNFRKKPQRLDAKVTRLVRQMVPKPETKVNTQDNSLHTSIISTTAKPFVDITQLQQSNDSNGRDGNKVFSRYISCRYQFNLSTPATAVYGCNVRLIIFTSDTQPHATDFATQSLFDSLDISRSKHIKQVLAQRSFTLTPVHKQNIYGRFFVKVMREIQWASSTQNDYRKNGIYCMLVTDASSGVEAYDASLQFNHSYVDN